MILVIMVLLQRENFARQMQQVNQYIKELSEREHYQDEIAFYDPLRVNQIKLNLISNARTSIL